MSLKHLPSCFRSVTSGGAVIVMFSLTVMLATSCSSPQPSMQDGSMPAGNSPVGTSPTETSAGGTPTPSNGSKFNVKADAEKFYAEHPEVEGGWSKAAQMVIEEKLGWNKLPDGEKSTSLPKELNGVTFLGDDGSEVSCLSGSKATILTPQDQSPIDATYTVGSPALELKYTDASSGKECSVQYAAQCAGRRAKLNVQSSTLPKLPSVLWGTLPE